MVTLPVLSMVQCSEFGHDSKSCKNAERCANCKSDHTTYSRSCPNWIFEKEILAKKVTQDHSYPEARKLVESRNPSIGVSYISILKQQSRPVRDISTQTEPSFSPSISPTTVPSSTIKKKPAMYIVLLVQGRCQN